MIPRYLHSLRNPLLATALALAVWQAVVWIGDMRPFILPGPARVAEALWVNRVALASNALVTFVEVLVGLALGALVGVATAIQLAASAGARAVVRPILVFMQAVPVFALAPVLTLWFGYGLAPKILVVMLIVYFPLAWAFFDGLTRTPRGWLDLAETMGAAPGRTMLRVRIPGAMPAFASGLRLATIYAPVGAIFGEWVGASSGLGHLMLLANGRAKVDLMFAALLVLAVFTVLLHAAVDRAARRLTERMSDAAA
jgi:putative hydroxymethylpyrimidine transport system permease protein